MVRPAFPNATLLLPVPLSLPRCCHPPRRSRLFLPAPHTSAPTILGMILQKNLFLALPSNLPRPPCPAPPTLAPTLSLPSYALFPPSLKSTLLHRRHHPVRLHPTLSSLSFSHSSRLPVSSSPFSTLAAQHLAASSTPAPVRMSSSSSAAAAAASSATSVAAIAREPAALPLPPIPQPSKVKIALCQLAVTSDKPKNISHAKEVIERAADEGAHLILLPEMWNCPYSNDSFPVFAEELEAPAFAASPSAAMLSLVAASKKVTIVGGSIPERRHGKLYNTSLVFGTNGNLLGSFSKIHLFDIDIPGKMTFKESLTLTPGDQLLVVDTEVGRIGVAICYDIRFPELAMLYAARGVHLLCYPGAFNMTTGPLHWELLQRSRAVDNQVFVATCSPARDVNASYTAWGHSTICGPFGEVIATTEHEEATVLAEIDLAEIPQRRQSLPFLTQRRGDLYTLVDKSRK